MVKIQLKKGASRVMAGPVKFWESKREKGGEGGRRGRSKRKKIIFFVLEVNLST